MSLDLALLNQCSEPLPFLALFEQSRSAGLLLTMDEYDLLQRSLLRGKGLESWARLENLCELLWVKPSVNYDRAVFRKVFRRFRDECVSALVEIEVEKGESQPVRELLKSSDPVMPQVPPRLMPDRQKTSKIQAPIGIQTRVQDGVRSGQGGHYTPTDLPISVSQMQARWRSLRQSGQSYADEVDVERTVEQISRVGFLEEVVMRSSVRGRSELVVLVDDGDGMTPYFPALQPLFKAIEGGWVHPAQVYRFTGYPTRFLYEWWRSSQPVAVDGVLSRVHRTRTIVMVVSDAGAAIGRLNGDRVRGTFEFLTRWTACVSQVLWLNPVPEVRWAGTCAEEIQGILGVSGDRMVALDEVDRVFVGGKL